MASQGDLLKTDFNTCLFKVTSWEGPARMGLVRIISDLFEVAQGVESIITITMYYATDSLISISGV